MHASEFETYEAFVRAVHNELPSNWETNLDEVAFEKGLNRVGFQRDDLYTWMISTPSSEDWPASEIHLEMPDEIDGIPDRPHVPVVTVDTPTVEAVVKRIKQESLEYEGTFEYDD